VTEQQLRQRRIALERQIADAFREQNHIYALHVKPYLAQARLASSAPKGSNAGTVRVLTLEEAEMLDRSTPTGAFEWGRAHVEHHSAQINRLRTQLRKVEADLARVLEEKRRGNQDAGGRAQAGQGSSRSASPVGQGLPGPLRQRLASLARLVLDARAGDRTLHGSAQ
jgi:hypothetical protein